MSGSKVMELFIPKMIWGGGAAKNSPEENMSEEKKSVGREFGQVLDVFIKRTFLLNICIFNIARVVFLISSPFFRSCLFHNKNLKW